MALRTRLNVLAWAASLLAIALPMRAQNTALDMWQAQRTTFENYVNERRPLGKHRIDQVFELRLDKKFLALYTPLPNMPTEEPMRAKLDGLAGTAMVSVHREDKGSGPAIPDRFSLNAMDFPAPRQAISLRISSQLQPDLLTISRTIQTTEGPLHHVILTQQRGPQSGGGGLVQLAIADSPAINQAAQQINYEAPDFFTFIHEYPQPTEQYVRPLLRAMGQESVFAPDPMVAWEVFGRLQQPDPAMARKVHDLLPGLDAADYHVRDAALVQLQRLGRAGARALLHLDRSKLTPEQNARIDRALLPYGHLSSKEADRLRSDAGFLLDCLYCDDPAIRQAAFERLRAMFRPDLQFDMDAPPAIRAAAINQLREQLKPVH